MVTIINDAAFADIVVTTVYLGVAFCLGALIGLERQYRHRVAGLRTNTLVALGAAGFVHLADLIMPGMGTARVISYVVSGMGFLGAGVIIRDGGYVRGINTAATMWTTAAIGACAGSGMIFTAITLCFFVLLINTMMRPIVNFMNRKFHAEEDRGIYVIHIICDNLYKEVVISTLNAELKRNSLVCSEIKTHEVTRKKVEILGFLMCKVSQENIVIETVERINRTQYVNKAFWLPVSESSVNG